MAEALWFATARLTIHLSQKDNADRLSLIEHHMAEGFAVPLHVHHDEDESFYILQGEVRMQIDNEVRRLAPGDALTVSGGTPHSFRIVSPEARFLSMTTGDDPQASPTCTKRRPTATSRADRRGGRGGGRSLRCARH
jgi:quercetin dioxygenase-like cupin family protein